MFLVVSNTQLHECFRVRRCLALAARRISVLVLYKSSFPFSALLIGRLFFFFFHFLTHSLGCCLLFLLLVAGWRS